MQSFTFLNCFVQKLSKKTFLGGRLDPFGKGRVKGLQHAKQPGSTRVKKFFNVENGVFKLGYLKTSIKNHFICTYLLPNN